MVVAAVSVRGWVVAIGIAAFLQSPAPIVVDAGGRLSGIMPAYALLAVGMIHAVLHALRPRSAPKSSAPKPAIPWLIAFTAIGVLGAIVLPRAFEGQVEVMPPAYGLDTLFIERVHPSGRNSVQAVYLICNLVLFLLCRWTVASRLVTIEQAVRGLILGAACSAALGLYQAIGYQLGLPWPNEIINSNTGVGQLYTQTAFGMRRMSATFLEPSLLGFHFLSAFALLGLGLRRGWIGGTLLLCLLISTSSSGYAGLLLLCPIALLLGGARTDRRLMLLLLLLMLVLGGAYLVDLLCMDGQVTSAFLTGKLTSASGIDRARTNWVALRTVFQSWGLGVGVGSSRVSGLPMTLLSTTGAPGLFCFAGFLWVLVRACLQRGDQYGRAFALAIIAMAIVWSLSIPDLALPYAWVLCGFASGLLSLPRPAEHRVSPKAVPMTVPARLVAIS
ncbi:MAG: hypothetical protein WB646_04440 [Steroidobacteraceae bacterium]